MVLAKEMALWIVWRTEANIPRWVTCTSREIMWILGPEIPLLGCVATWHFLVLLYLFFLLLYFLLCSCSDILVKNIWPRFLLNTKKSVDQPAWSIDVHNESVRCCIYFLILPSLLVHFRMSTCGCHHHSSQIVISVFKLFHIIVTHCLHLGFHVLLWGKFIFYEIFLFVLVSFFWPPQWELWCALYSSTVLEWLLHRDEATLTKAVMDLGKQSYFVNWVCWHYVFSFFEALLDLGEVNLLNRQYFF